VAYKLSKQPSRRRRSLSAKIGVDLGKVATVFIVYGIISLITSWVFSMETQRVFSDKVRTYVNPSVPTQHAVDDDQDEDEARNEENIGPITINGYKEVYEITIATSLPENNWAFIEGKVLDAEKEYLFSFGKELWHETGYDYDGTWRESENNYSMKITFPQPGQYYLSLKTEGSYNLDEVQVTISKKLGSSIPHMVFGIFTLLVGIILNEIRNKTLSKIVRSICNGQYS
jgi:hypothetical protein